MLYGTFEAKIEMPVFVGGEEGDKPRVSVSLSRSGQARGVMMRSMNLTFTGPHHGRRGHESAVFRQVPGVPSFSTQGEESSEPDCLGVVLWENDGRGGTAASVCPGTVTHT